MQRKDITDRVEQLQPFEDRLKVTIKAVSAFACRDDEDEDVRIVVRGELHPGDGDTLSQDIQINLSIYDKSDRVIETDSDFVNAEDFFGFHTFELSCYPHTTSISKLRLYPQAC